MTKKIKTNIPQKNRVRSELQKEIKSICPFCDNEDVGHFEIHHIDENPSNHTMSNLILICPTCHSKITKEDISRDEVVITKNELKNKNGIIQFVSVSVDSKNCGWEQFENVPNAFEAIRYKSFFPIFNFILINQSSKTVLLTSISIKVERLPIGLSGPNIPLPSILRPIIKYKIEMPSDGETRKTMLSEEIQVPQSRAFKFQVELYDESMERFKPPFNKYALYLEFGFNNDFYTEIPMILLNTNQYYTELKHYGIS